jgi:hypothetical protein
MADDDDDAVREELIPRTTKRPNPAVYDEATNTVRMRMQNGIDAIIDAEDYHRVKDYRWMAGSCWIVAMTHDNKPVYLHRWVAGVARGQRVIFASSNNYDCRKQNLVYEDGVRTRKTPTPAHKKPGTRGYAMPRMRGQIRLHGFMDRQNADGEITQRGAGPRPLILIEVEESEEEP